MTGKQTRASGYVHVYTGNGKGKTTAAIGLALRSLGAGKRVYVAQFIKGRASGEIEALRAHFPEAEIECFGLGRFVRGAPSEKDIEAAQRGMHRLRQVLTSGEHHVVVAAELNGAIRAGLIPLDQVLDLLAVRPDHVELVITGRNAHARLMQKADLVTEMRNLKHYLDKGVPAREGIEY